MLLVGMCRYQIFMLVVTVRTKTKENRYSFDPVVHKTWHMMEMWFSTMWIFPPRLFSSELAI